MKTGTTGIGTYITTSLCCGKDDSDLLRRKIIDMSYIEWKKMGFSKGTLHYMKQNAKNDKPFTLNTHVRDRLEKWNEEVSVDGNIT